MRLYGLRGEISHVPPTTFDKCIHLILYIGFDMRNLVWGESEIKTNLLSKHKQIITAIM